MYIAAQLATKKTRECIAMEVGGAPAAKRLAAWEKHESKRQRRAADRAKLGQHLPLVERLKRYMMSGNLKQAVPAFLSVISEKQANQIYRAGSDETLLDATVLNALTITHKDTENKWMDCEPPAHERVPGEPLSIYEIVHECIANTPNGANDLACAMLDGAEGVDIPTPIFYTSESAREPQIQSDSGTTTIEVMTKADFDEMASTRRHIYCYSPDDVLPQGNAYNVLVSRREFQSRYSKAMCTHYNVLFYQDTTTNDNPWAAPREGYLDDYDEISKAACAMIAYQFDPPNPRGRAILRASFVDKASASASAAAFCLNNTANDFSR